jgi:hypothetical protein
MKMEQIECSETSAYKIQTPGNHPEENIQHKEKKCLQNILSPIQINVLISKDKAIPLQAWTGLEGSRRLRLPDFKTFGIWKW